MLIIYGDCNIIELSDFQPKHIAYPHRVVPALVLEQRMRVTATLLQMHLCPDLFTG